MFQSVMLYPINTFQTVFDCTDERLPRQINDYYKYHKYWQSSEGLIDLKEKKTIHHVHMDIKDLLRCNRSHL